MDIPAFEGITDVLWEGPLVSADTTYAAGAAKGPVVSIGQP